MTRLKATAVPVYIVGGLSHPPSDFCIQAAHVNPQAAEL